MQLHPTCIYNRIVMRCRVMQLMQFRPKGLRTCILSNAVVMQCLQGWVAKTHPLQVHRITLHPRGYEVMQLMQFGRLLPL
jgi:hypothetical protein